MGQTLRRKDPLVAASSLNIAGFAGSLRKASYNSALLRTTVELAAPEMTVTPIDISGIPFFDADVEKEGDPSSVRQLKDAVREADGLVIFTPEYNGSVSAVTKNAIDWLSRRTGDTGSPLSSKPVGIVAATPGRRGAKGAREHLSYVIGLMSNSLYGETLGIASVNTKFGDGQQLTDPTALSEMEDWLAGFGQHVRRSISPVVYA